MNKKNFLATLVGTTLFSISTSAQTIDTTVSGQSFEHLWSKCVGAGRANEGLRAGWLEQLSLVQKNCGYEYDRFLGLFHDD